VEAFGDLLPPTMVDQWISEKARIFGELEGGLLKMYQRVRHIHSALVRAVFRHSID
jgi:hypothetical protein